MKRLGALLIVISLMLLVAIPLTAMANNNQNGVNISTLKTVMTSSVSPGLERASPAQYSVISTIDLCTISTGVMNSTYTVGSLTFTSDQILANRANILAGTVTTNRFNDMSTTINLATTLTNKASPVVIDATQGANLTNDPATALNKASPVNAAVNSNSTINAVLNHTAGALAYMPSTTIKGAAGDNNDAIITSVTSRAYGHRMGQTLITLAVTSMNTADQNALVAANWSLHRQTTAENSADSRDVNLGGATNTTITVTFGATISAMTFTINGVMT